LTSFCLLRTRKKKRKTKTSNKNEVFVSMESELTKGSTRTHPYSPFYSFLSFFLSIACLAITVWIYFWSHWENKGVIALIFLVAAVIFALGGYGFYQQSKKESNPLFPEGEFSPFESTRQEQEESVKVEYDKGGNPVFQKKGTGK
jgi:heme/copper-type cytochrome/quinol oxidase subunit 4